MKKHILVAITVGVTGWILYAILASVIVPRIFTYSTPTDEAMDQLIWAWRIITDKAINLAIVFIAGMALGSLIQVKSKLLLCSSVVLTLVYQACGISYVIIRWGFSYYLESHSFFKTLWVSFTFCIIGAFIMYWILNLTGRTNKTGEPIR